MPSVAVKQFCRPVSISTNVTINTIALIVYDNSLTQCDIAAQLILFTLKVCRNCLIVIHDPIEVYFLLSCGRLVQVRHSFY